MDPIQNQVQNSNSGSKKWLWITLGVVLLIAIIILVIFMLNGNKPNGQLSSNDSTKPNTEVASSTEITFSFLGDTYKKGFTLPGRGKDFTSESYEWVKGNDTVDNWQTLITTHELTQLEPGDYVPVLKISAESYAQNVASMLKDSGAIMTELSVINTKDAADSGVDITNPPYLLVYVFPPAKSGGIAEVGIQRIQNADNGNITSFIYAQKKQMSSQKEFDTFLASKEFTDKRMAVILAKFPY